MNITQKEMDEINSIQLEIFKEFLKVCSELKLKYYVIHGTLLGALKYKGFFPFDDDIDVAMPRKDYEIFINEGQKLLKDNLFIQCTKTELEYPLVFAKLRNTNTTFIQSNLENYNINKGIYIDIFPIDNYPNSKIKQKIINFKKIIYTFRISTKMNIKRTKKQKIAMSISKVFCPSWHFTMRKLSDIYIKEKQDKNCIIYGGKSSEIEIPFEYFGKGKKMKFEKLEVIVPSKYENYLATIYGDYNNYFPAEKYMKSEKLVEVSAKIIDTKNSYKIYNIKEN